MCVLQWENVRGGVENKELNRLKGICLSRYSWIAIWYVNSSGTQLPEEDAFDKSRGMMSFGLLCCCGFPLPNHFCLGCYNGKVFGLNPNFLKSLLLLGGEGDGSKSKLAFQHQSHKVEYSSQFVYWFFFCVSSLFFLCFPQLDGCLPSWLSLCLCVEY